MIFGSLSALSWRLVGKTLAAGLIVAAIAWAMRDVRQAYSQRAAYRTELAVLTSQLQAERLCTEPSLCRQRAAETAHKAAAAVLPYVSAWGDALANARVAQRNAEAQRAYEVSELARRLREASQHDDSCAAYLRTPIDCDLGELLHDAPGAAGGEGRSADHGGHDVPDPGRPATAAPGGADPAARPADP